MALPRGWLGSYEVMGPLGDHTPLTNILTVAAAVAVGVGAWFLLWRLVDLLPNRLKRPASRDGVMDTLRAGVVSQELLTIQSGASTLPTSIPQKRSNPPKWISYLFLVTGVVVGPIALVSFADTFTFLRTAVSAPGKVVALEQIQCEHTVCYAPRVLFRETVHGRQIEFVSPASSNPPAFHADEQVTVLYSQEKPERAMVQGLFSIWGGPIILFSCSVLFVIFGACSLLFPNLFASG